MDFCGWFYCLKRDFRNACTEEREKVVCKFAITKVISSNDVLHQREKEARERSSRSKIVSRNSEYQMINLDISKAGGKQYTPKNVERFSFCMDE